MRGGKPFSGTHKKVRYKRHFFKPNNGIPEDTVQTHLKNPLNVFAAYFQFTTKCIIPDHEPCARCIKKKKRRCCCLSLEEGIGKTPAYTIDELTSVKNDLNHIRSCLDSFNIEEWKAHTSRTLITTKVVPTIRRLGDNHGKSPPEMVTNAWCKMYELLRGCQLISRELVYSRSPPELRTAHLCECPGGFICAVNHYLHTSVDMMPPSQEEKKEMPPKLTWRAVSLNPYFEGNDLNAMIDDDVFYRFLFKSALTWTETSNPERLKKIVLFWFRQTHYNWLRGEDDSGDIRKVSNINHFTRELVYLSSTMTDALPKEPPKPEHFTLVDLVTADGSVDSQYDANAQEIITAPLHLCEFFTALKFLAQKGHLVLKMFTLFEHHSLSLVALASCLFETVFIAKPVMSRAGSGEVYLVAKNFLGLSSSLNTETFRYISSAQFLEKCFFPRHWIPQNFYNEFCHASKLFAERQTLSIKSNLSSYNTPDMKTLEASIAADRVACVRRFMSVLAIRPIPRCLKLVQKIHLSGGQNHSSLTCPRKRIGGVQSDRLEFKVLFDTFQSLRLEQAKAHSKQIPVFLLRLNDPNLESVQEACEPPVNVSCTSKTLHMMQKMNYVEGQGLGKLAQGRTEPVLPVALTVSRGLISSTDARRVSLPLSVFTLRKDSDLYLTFNQINSSTKYYLTKIQEKIYTTALCKYNEKFNVDDRDFITWGTPLPSCQVKISRFLEDALLTQLIRVRIEKPDGDVALPVFTPGDCFLLQKGYEGRWLMRDCESPGEPELLRELPNSAAVDLLFVLKDCLTFSEDSLKNSSIQAQSQKRHFLNILLKEKFRDQTILELSNNGLLLPTASVFGSLGIRIRLVLSEDIVQHTLDNLGCPSISAAMPKLQEELNNRCFPGFQPFEFVRPLYWKSIFSNRIPAKTMLGLTFRQHLSRQLNSLVYIDPFKTHFSESLRIEREYAHLELKSAMSLLALTIMGLASLAHSGHMVIKLYSTVTRFTITLILVLSFHFENVYVYRPPSVAAWTSARYVFFEHARWPPLHEEHGHQNSPVLAYLMWCWDASISKFPTVSIMQLLPPLCYTDAALHEWVSNWNNTLAEEELEDLLHHLNNNKRSITSQDEVLQTCKDFLNTHHVLGFFIPHLLSPTEFDMDLGFYRNHNKNKELNEKTYPTFSFHSKASNPSFQTETFTLNAFPRTTELNSNCLDETSFGTPKRASSSHGLPYKNPQSIVFPSNQIQWLPSTLSHMDVEMSLLSSTL